MLYKIAHLLRDKFPWIWNFIGMFNALIFRLIYGKRLMKIPSLLEQYHNIPLKKLKEGDTSDNCKIEPLSLKNISLLKDMFDRQPDEAFNYFKPHGFDLSTLSRLMHDDSFLSYVVLSTNSNSSVCVGYFFQRSFFWGKTYRGYMTDYAWQRRGINKLMNKCATDIASLLGLRVFGTIAPENLASLKSAQQANDVQIIETLSNGDYYVEYLPKRHH